MCIFITVIFKKMYSMQFVHSHFSCSQIFAGDNLPTQVCHECADQINSFDSFKLMCENTNHILNEHLQKQQSGNVPGKVKFS